MPLYSGIFSTSLEDVEKSVPQQQDAKPPMKISTPSASMRLLQDHLISKRRSKQASLPPQKIQKLSDKSQVPVGAPIRYSEFDWDLFDEYDPMAPNSYEILQLEALKADEQKLHAMKSSVGKIDPNILDVLDRLEEGEGSEDGANLGAAIAPPPKKQLQVSDSDTVDKVEPKNVSAATTTGEKLDGVSAAAKIMAKMGFKLGQGLGRNEQGMNAPLEVEMSGPSLGRIVHKFAAPTPQSEIKPDCTRVLLLQNMVGPGEVDDELEEETKMECMKYGKVIKCLIYEIPNKRVPDDQAVRIFIEFENSISAKKATDELNGRYFGGRLVRASFYDVDKFHKYELGL